MKKIAGVLAGVSIAVTVAACGSDDPAGAPPLESQLNGDNAELNDGAKYLGTAFSDTADVDEDSISFPASRCGELKQLQPGSVIMGDAQQPNTSGNNPEGFLRKVVSVECTPDGVKVKTAPAAIQDGFKNLNGNGSVKFPSCKSKGKGGSSLGLDYSNYKLLEERGTTKISDGSTVPYTLYANLDEAYVCASPKFDFKIDLKGFNLNSFLATATGQVQASLVMTAGVKLDGTPSAQARTELAFKTIAKSISRQLIQDDVPVGSVTFGFIKLPITVGYTSQLDCDFSFTAPVEAKAGGRETASVTMGFKYDSKAGLSPVFDKTLNFTPVLPTFTKDGLLRAMCTVTPKFQLKVFGIASGAFVTKVRAGVGGEQECQGRDAQGVAQRLLRGDGEVGIYGGLLAELNLYKILKWKKECALFDEHKIAHYDRTYPDPAGPNAACMPGGPFPLPAPVAANPKGCFGDPASPATDDPGIIVGECTHDVCHPGDKIGQQCDTCTMKVCQNDPYCCDTFWGASCIESVSKYCGIKCTP